MTSRRTTPENPSPDSSNSIWDDGEWVSWDYINQHLEGSIPDGGLVEDLIIIAKSYYDETGRHLSIYGEIGEHYAARRFGIDLHVNCCAQGSDGRLGDVFVEIKTISPLRDSRHVKVKKSGNFGALVIVKIDADFRIDAKMILRKKLSKSLGDYYLVSWGYHACDYNQARLRC